MKIAGTEWSDWKTYHMGIAKSLLMKLIAEHGTDVLVGCTATPAVKLQQLAADPRTTITFEKCDNQNPDGSCAGHHEAQ